MKNRFDIILLITLFMLGLTTRTIFHVAPNVEFVTITSMAAGYFFTNKKLAILVPLSIMLVSDMIIGNTSIFIFTWSGFILSTLLGYLGSSEKLQNKFGKNSEISKAIVVGTAGSILSVMIFYLWTNFGVVVTSAMYPNTLVGLIESYINAIPFLKNQLAGNIIFAPMIFAMIALAKEMYLNKLSKQKLHFK